MKLRICYIEYYFMSKTAVSVCYRPRRFTLKGYKQFFFVCRDMKLLYYRSNDEMDIIETINLQGCEVTPDVIISSQRYGIKLEVPGQQSMTEYMLRCSDVSGTWHRGFIYLYQSIMRKLVTYSLVSVKITLA